MYSYTTSRAISSASGLTNFLEAKGKIQIDSYAPDPVTKLVTLSLVQPPDVSFLDALVASYIDSPSLTTEDILSFRYFRAYRGTDLPLTTTANFVNVITLSTLGVSDLNYYSPSSDRTYINIMKPGVYLLKAKVGAYCPTNLTTTSTIQWYFQYDSTRTGNTWINMTNAFAYTVHHMPLPAADTTVLSMAYNVTNPAGVYVRLACKMVTGTGAALSIGGNMVSWEVIQASGACYYEGTSTVATALTTVPKALPLNTDRIINAPFTHTAGSASVKVNLPGTVYAISKLTVSKTAGTDASVAECDLLVNGALQTGNGQVFAKSLSTAGNKVTLINSGTIDVAAGDLVSTQALISSGTSLTATSGDSGLMLMYLSTINSQDNLFTGDVAINAVQASSVITSTPLDVQFESQTESFPNYSLGVTFNGTTSYLTTNTTGYFAISGDITVYNPNNIQRTIYVVVSLSVDSVFYEQPGTLAAKQVMRAGKTTINTQHLIYLTANSKIKLQVYSPDATAADNIQMADCTNLSVHCLNGASMVAAQAPSYTSNSFGTDFYYLTALEPVVFSSTAFVEHSRLSPGFLLAGTFRLHIEATLFTSNALDSYTLQLTDTVVNQAGTAQTSVLLSNAVDYTMPIFRRTLILTFPEGVHTIIFQVSSPKGSPITCAFVCTELWRIS